MSALMVSANTGSVINAAQINHRNSLSAPGAQTTGSQVSSTQTTSSKISSTQTNNAQVNTTQVNTTQATTTKSIDTPSAAVQSNWVNSRSLKSSSNSIQAPATSTFNASIEPKVNLPSTDTQPLFRLASQAKMTPSLKKSSVLIHSKVTV
jgi:hypothetical protein